MVAADVKLQLQKVSNTAKVPLLLRFFKTGPGEYGEGDLFIGVNVPDQRKIARQFVELDLAEVQKLLQDPIHEYRLTALFILRYKFRKTKEQSSRKQLLDFYLKNLAYVNNWDLVDSSAEIVGEYLLIYPGSDYLERIYLLAKSEKLWERRVAIISTFASIKQKQLRHTIKIAELLLQDRQDLIHKAVGWMLREAGKRDKTVLIKFLNSHSSSMPRTMLRYAIEKLAEHERQKYLKAK